jgi:hypothetical protein
VTAAASEPPGELGGLVLRIVAQANATQRFAINVQKIASNQFSRDGLQDAAGSKGGKMYA